MLKFWHKTENDVEFGLDTSVDIYTEQIDDVPLLLGLLEKVGLQPLDDGPRTILALLGLSPILYTRLATA